MEETPTRVPPAPAEVERAPENDNPNPHAAPPAAGRERPVSDAAATARRDRAAAPLEAGPGGDAARPDAAAERPRRRRRRRGRGERGGSSAHAREPSPEGADAAPGPPHAAAPKRSHAGSDSKEPHGGAASRRPHAAASDRSHADEAARSEDSHAGRHASHEEAHPSPRRAARAFALDPDLPSPAHEPEIPVERLDADAVKVISRLRHMGHQAYFVGGCVRDLMLGLKPKDFDIATDAHPGEVRAIFRNCRLIGRRFRLAHVYFRGGKIIEVATFRANPIDVADDVPSDADLLITRDNVFGTAEEDARRRDFTVNGLFYDPFLGEVLDYVGGRADLEAHRIATIGDPEIRMREDPVRSLRAIRFAARLGFAIEPETFAAMRRSGSEIARCAPPRVLEETFKILRCGNAARAFELLRAAGALPMVLPALAQALDAGEAATRARFQAHLAALDALVRSGADVSEAVLLGALLMHLRRDPGAGEPVAGGARRAPGAIPAGDAAGGDGGADELLAQLVQTARLPRRMAERTRLAMGAQRAFRGPPRRRRRRGGGLTAQAYFQDALQLLEITVRATGEGAEALASWRTDGQAHASAWAEAEERSVEGRGATRDAGGQADIPVFREPAAGEGPDAEGSDRPDAPGTAGGDEAGPRRRRRRRGGRRRRRRGGGAGAGAPSAGGA
jgi:poly(A) polymerase